ncbi:MAG: hypothetical protein PHD76_15260, partial [Methylacidiphilales bacterium]|nr:hypothetical protein [Candidatus Methylacidiphilales bacterium]
NHEPTWYRIIGTTHYDNPATDSESSIEGYGLRFTLANGSINPGVCSDCHGHEANAGTRTGQNTPTLYTDWAQSGHARGILTAKYAAAAANPVDTSLPRTDPVRTAQGLKQVDAVMAAGVAGGAFAGHEGTSCGRCHTTEGFSAFFTTFSTANMGTTPGVLKCYGCHSNAGAGILRTMKGANPATDYSYASSATGWNPKVALDAGASGYKLNYGKSPYPDMGRSNACIFCHDSREKDPGAITDASTNYQRTHYLQAATTMFVKMGFITFAPGSIPGVEIDKTLLSDQDGGTITSTHRKLGTPAMIGNEGITAKDKKLTSGGPCVSCHFSASHSQEIDQRSIDAVCIRCHDSEMGHSLSKEADFKQYFLEPQSEAYQAALTLAINIFNNMGTGITIAAEPAPLDEFVRAYKTGTTTEAGAADWTAAMAVLGSNYNKARVMGAVSNIVYFKRDPGAFVHARTYSRRLIYDTIDYLDDGTMNGSTGATALATMPSVYGKGASAFTDGTLTVFAPGTTEAMVYLIRWSRATGAWSTPERP